MTIATTATRANYTGDAIITQFSFSFKTLDEAHIYPYLDAVVQGSGFTVTLNADQEASPGGVVDFTVAPADGELVTIERLVPLTQQTDYPEYDPFPSATHEEALDFATMQSQQIDDANSRAIQAPVTDDGSVDYTLPTAVANKGLKWNPAGDGLENTADDIDTIVADATAQAVIATDQASAASGSASAAAGSASAASSSASAALVSENKAEDWAEELEDVPVEVGQFSALHHAAKAAASAATSADLSNTVSGTDTYTATLGISAYTSGKTYYLSFTNTNTIAAPTLNFDSKGAKTIKNLDGSALAIGTIPDEALVRYDGTDMILLNPQILFASAAEVATGTNDEKIVSPLTQGEHLTASKAWIRFDGSGAVSIYGSFNVSSVTDNGTGSYSVNFTDDMVDTNYAMGTSCGTDNNTREVGMKGAPTVSSVGIYTSRSTVLEDVGNISAIIFGN